MTDVLICSTCTPKPMLQECLREYGLSSEIVNDGLAVVAFAEIHWPSLLVMDLRMNRRNAILVLERLRTVPLYDFDAMIIASHRDIGRRMVGYLDLLSAKVVHPDKPNALALKIHSVIETRREVAA